MLKRWNRKGDDKREPQIYSENIIKDMAKRKEQNLITIAGNCV